MHKETEAFLAEILPKQRDMTLALYRGDVAPRLAYTVGFEHSSAVVDGIPAVYTMRTTHVDRREEGAWRIVHRHSDLLADQIS